ncbi:MAG: hypothetical protein GQ569_00785 [Methylococcaceae bacterium]|nr:hypothetical protein [Methylococcaceae bacterium]
MKKYNNKILKTVFITLPLSLAFIISTPQQLSAEEISAEKAPKVNVYKKTQRNKRGRVTKNKIYLNYRLEPSSKIYSPNKEGKKMTSRGERKKNNNTASETKLSSKNIKRNCTKLNVKRKQCSDRL